MIADVGQTAGVDLQPAETDFASTEARESRALPTAVVARAGRTDVADIAPSSTDADVLLTPPATDYIDGEDWTTPDATATPGIFRRTVRTTLPFVISDLIALAVCGLVAQLALHFMFPDSAKMIGWAGPIALAPLVVVYWLGGLYSEIWVHPVLELRQMTHLNTIALLAAAAGGTFAEPFPIWFAVSWLAAIPLVPFMRAMCRRVCSGRSWWGYPTLIIGTGHAADALARMIAEAPNSGLRPVLLTDPAASCRSSILPVVNDPSTLESLLRAEGIRHAVVSLPDFSASRLSEMLDRYGGLLPHLLVLSDASTLPTLWGASRNCGRLSGIEVRNGLLMATLQRVKRLFDLTIALGVIACSLPVILVIMVMIKLTSKGRIFYGHKRIGRRGKLFKAWKFRTMYVNGDAILKEHLANNPVAAEEWERDQKLKDDPRVTWFGGILRKTSLDELPQVWNVLLGEMSFVGPRPIVKDEIRRYGQALRLYTTVKPGITGLWQVSGRSDISYADRVRLDLFYIRHWSPWLDLYIVGKTFIALASRDGAY
jgi:Undecaprenyl-phosphate galactose phosphotransferase WbaP